MFSPVNGSAQSLDDYKWKNRIVILVDQASDTNAMQVQLELFLNEKAEMADRDLILFMADGANIVNANKNKVAITLAELRKVAHIGSEFKGVLLIGKDGGCKLKKDFQIEPKEIFDLIDGMPMRRSEMKNQR